MGTKCDFSESEVQQPTPPSSVQDEPHTKTKKIGLKLSYEEYKHMANLLVLHLRKVEESAAEGTLSFKVI